MNSKIPASFSEARHLVRCQYDETSYSADSSRPNEREKNVHESRLPIIQRFALPVRYPHVYVGTTVSVDSLLAFSLPLSD
jgi:hypothetical protein